MRQLKTEVWPHQTTLTIRENFDKVDKWCIENIGLRFRDWYSYGLDPQRRIYAFKQEDILLVFKLTWGGL